MDILLIIYIISASATFFYLFLIMRYSLAWKNLKSHKQEPSFQANTFISIIVPVRNEEICLNACLKSLADQDYPNSFFEILVLNDGSTDQSENLAKEFFATNPLVSGRIINLIDKNGKKDAITEGVKVAKGTLIITTDADCTAKESWVSTIASFYEKDKPKMIAAPVLLHSQNSIFQKIMELEFLGLIAATAASISHSKPIMCNGANLAFEKEAFNKVQGYGGGPKTLSGDDVFLLGKIQKKFPGEIMFLKSRSAIVYTMNNPNLHSFISQRSRWVSKVRMIPDSNTLIIAIIVYSINFLLIANMIFWLVLPNYNGTFLIVIFGLKAIIDYLFLHLSSFYFGKRNLMRYFLPAEILNLFYVTFIGVIGNMATSKWKERPLLQK